MSFINLYPMALLVPWHLVECSKKMVYPSQRSRKHRLLVTSKHHESCEHLHHQEANVMIGASTPWDAHSSLLYPSPVPSALSERNHVSHFESEYLLLGSFKNAYAEINNRHQLRRHTLTLNYSCDICQLSVLI